MEFQLGQPPADMVAYIQGFWDTLTEQQRQELLTVDIKELQEKALVCDSHSGKHYKPEIIRIKCTALATAAVLTEVSKCAVML